MRHCWKAYASWAISPFWANLSGDFGDSGRFVPVHWRDEGALAKRYLQDRADLRVG